jgi:uncharacterized protein (DUF1501 family)
MNLQHQTRVAIDRQGVVRRRDFLRGVSAAGLAAGTCSWTDTVSLQASELRRQGLACILLWMPGGPSQLETLDPKPGHSNSGETKAIDTNVPGIRLADNLPHLAKVADRLAIVRSMTTKEGNHQRASYLLHTAYVPTASIHHPTLGSVVTHEAREAACELPAFVRIGTAFANTSNGGFLGTEYDAFVVGSAERPPENVALTTSTDRYQRRLQLMGQLESLPGSSAEKGSVYDHGKLYENASRMVLSPQMQAFDLSKESDKTREAYGKTQFGNSCLLARRLIETGVTFVEAALPNWDTHFDNFSKTRTLCGQLDQPFAQLLIDLEQRGMLERTLVVWMGEFGRTPQISPRGGRDHFPRAFSVALAGAGIRGGQVIGATDPAGESIASQPISEKDLFQSIYKRLKIDAHKENMTAVGRPMRVVDGGTPVPELIS